MASQNTILSELAGLQTEINRRRADQIAAIPGLIRAITLRRIAIALELRATPRRRWLRRRWLARKDAAARADLHWLRRR